MGFSPRSRTILSVQGSVSHLGSIKQLHQALDHAEKARGHLKDLLVRQKLDATRGWTQVWTCESWCFRSGWQRHKYTAAEFWPSVKGQTIGYYGFLILECCEMLSITMLSGLARTMPSRDRFPACSLPIVFARLANISIPKSRHERIDCLDILDPGISHKHYTSFAPLRMMYMRATVLPCPLGPYSVSRGL